ncbi:PRO41 protein [Cercophora scortea]|uniref:PRO41 protein n=1 Tax=Cercophora scortea TaxID=314031 RepID=A0AAE0J4M1_9PEZI|nr:PRO41 protein [Cercophora scortea]
MGRLIKNHWARLIVLSAATYQIAAALSGFFWPKIFWDFLTKTLDPAVKPIPVLQWPLGFIAGTGVHRSLEARLAFLPLTALAAALTYQGTNAAIYELIGLGVYFWAYSEGEIICAKPWTLPQRGGSRIAKV